VGTGCVYERAQKQKDRYSVRINFALVAVALSGLIATSPVALAQSEKGNTELPEGAGGQFGPRAGQQGQGQPQQGQGQPAPPPSETIGTFGAWQVQCTELPKEQGGKSCGMIQNAKAEKDERAGLTIIVSRPKRDGKTFTIMRIIAPIGVFLPNGIPVEIDGAALPNRMPYLNCAPRACFGQGEPGAETLTKFRKGTKATFYLYAGPGNGIPVPVSLDGFGKAMDQLDKL
jgi:invasion protein IalB